MFRFTIRDVLWLMVVVGMGLVWWLDHSLLSNRLTQAERVAEVVSFLDDRYPDWREETLKYLQEERMLPTLTEKASPDEN
jgi:hypothetical protein